MQNIPEVTLGLISVSRDCFPINLSVQRRDAVAKAYRERYGALTVCDTCVENERDMLKAIADMQSRHVNALAVFLGNFGPEAAETQIAKLFDGPVMYAAAAEENTEVLHTNRGDAYCGMLNCSYNLGLRRLKSFIPAAPVGDAGEVAELLHRFVPAARAILGLHNLKILSFGPRPQDFFACNAPLQPLYDLGVEIQENSELDLLVAFHAHAGDARIPGVIADMKQELGGSSGMDDLLPKLAQYELTLLDLAEAQRGARKYVVFANKCWPAFQTEFGFMPCYVNSRLTSRGIPVSCEVDIYGALSEYIGTCVSGECVTLLDINNTVPQDLYDAEIRPACNYRLHETFMGFHCGNSPICRLRKGSLGYNIIMHRGLEPDSEPIITRGTLEGDLVPGDITFFRLQGTADGKLRAYVAQGEILPARCHSFGGIGVFAIPDMERFYRYVLISKNFPHHGAVAFGHCGEILYDVFSYLGVTDISYNHPPMIPYETENPYSAISRLSRRD